MDMNHISTNNCSSQDTKPLDQNNKVADNNAPFQAKSSHPSGEDGAMKAANGGGPDNDQGDNLSEGGDIDVDFPGGRDGQHHPIAEFLYQLTKMLTDDNSEIIEWADGRIKVHHPERLEAEVLHKYFRHSKFASFQRQLNYFGFRKMAGKGKMSPCSYVNEAATSDIRSLLLIKRKTNGSAARKAAMEQRAAALTNPMNNGMLGMNLLGGGMGVPGMAGLGMNPGGGTGNLSNQLAMLSENALRAQLGQLGPTPLGGGVGVGGLGGLGNPNSISNTQLSLLALQQQQQQLQQQLQQQQQSEQLKQLMQQQQQLQQQQQQQQQQNNNNQMNALAPGSMGFQNQMSALSSSGMQDALSSFKSNMKSRSLEELQAQLAAGLAQTQKQNDQGCNNNNNDGQQGFCVGQQGTGNSNNEGGSQEQQQQQSNNFGGMNFGNPATAALKQASQSNGLGENPATAALQAQGGNLVGGGPATAAMGAASQALNQQNSNNLFESAINLKSLLQEHQDSLQQANASAAQGFGGAAASTQAAMLRNRLPSSTGLFGGADGNAGMGGLGGSMSIGNFLGSSNRLNSLLSLGSFMGSRETSLADFAGLNGGLGSTAQFGQAGGMSSSMAQMQGNLSNPMNHAQALQALQAEASRLRNQ